MCQQLPPRSSSSPRWPVRREHGSPPRHTALQVSVRLVSEKSFINIKKRDRKLKKRENVSHRHGGSEGEGGQL